MMVTTGRLGTMPNPDGRPTALISWAHTNPGWSDEQTRLRQDHVLRLAAELRQSGIDVDLDLFHLSESVDWTRWGPQQVEANDFVLVVVSERWRAAWEGTGDPTRGAGAVAEADALQSLFATDQSKFLNKVRPVLLPAATDSDIPRGLHGVPRYHFTPGDVDQLQVMVRALTGQPEFAPTPLGPLSVLPPVALKTGLPEEEQLANTLRALPSPTAADQPSAPWYRERQDVEDRLRALDPATDTAGPADTQKTRFIALTEPVSVQWRSEFAAAHGSRAILAIHLLPVPAAPLTARVLATTASELPARVRTSPIVGVTQALRASDDDAGASVLMVSPDDQRWGYREVAPPAVQGIRVGRTGQVSVWTTLPADSMGTLIDESSLTSAITDCLTLAHSAAPTASPRLAIAAEINPVAMVNIGAAGAPPRTTMIMHGFGSSDEFRLDPDESIDTQAVIEDRAAIATMVASLMMRSWRQKFRG